MRISFDKKIQQYQQTDPYNDIYMQQVSFNMSISYKYLKLTVQEELI